MRHEAAHEIARAIIDEIGDNRLEPGPCQLGLDN